MSTQLMVSPQEARIAKFAGETLKHVLPHEVIGRIGVGVKKPMPKNKSETQIFRRWLPKGATAATPNNWNVDPASHRLNEGETPNAEAIIAQDISVTLEEYGVLYRYSNRVGDLYEDDVPMEMKMLTGERMGLLLEMIRWGVLKAGTNKFFAGGVSSRSSVIGLLSANGFRNIARSMSSNLATVVTEMLSGSVKVGTVPVEPGYVVVHHTNLTSDLRSELGADYTPAAEYGTTSRVHENESGKFENFRFIPSPHLAPYLAAGGTGAAANSRLSNGVPNSAGTEAADVYPMLVMSEKCFGDVMLRGREAISVTHIPANEKTKDDPHGQRGYVGAQTYFACVRLNEGHMAIYEVAAKAL